MLTEGKRKTSIDINAYIYRERDRETRKMVLMNLFAGQQRRHSHREQACGWRVGRMERVAWKHRHYHM